ncbi:MFS general substrate transporter, partial [Fistulina hepatica ATCC 64428]
EWDYPDGGLRAWLVVFGCFLLAGFSLGWGLVYGIFQDYYEKNVFTNTPLSVLSLISSLLNFASFFFLNRGITPDTLSIIGLSVVLTFVSMLASSFATTLWEVFLFQAVCTGISIGFAMPLIISLPSQWFLRRRGFATGIAVCGVGIVGAIMCLIGQALLVKVGYKHCLLIFTFLQVAVCVFALLLVRERRPPSHDIAKQRWLPQKTTLAFCTLSLSCFTSNFGYLVPYIFIQTYTRETIPTIDPTSLLITVPLTVMSFSGNTRQILSGFMADTIGPFNCFFLSFFLGGVFQIAIWSFAKTYGAIIAFSILYGIAGNWFFGLLPVVCSRLFGMDGLATITGFMVLMTAPGQLAGQPIGAAVRSAAHSSWQALAFYSGAMMLLGSLFAL